MSNTHEIVCKILNQGGAEIHVLKKPGSYDLGHGWQCAGCGQGDDPAEFNNLVTTARASAERHADKCRFVPA